MFIGALRLSVVSLVQDFQIQMLERKMSRLQGRVNTDEKEALEKRVSDLTEALAEKKKTATSLTKQLKKLQVRACVIMNDYTFLLLSGKSTALGMGSIPEIAHTRKQKMCSIMHFWIDVYAKYINVSAQRFFLM